MLSAIDFNSLDLHNPAQPPKKELDKDAFLKLLIAQLQHQDPLDPLKDQEFIGQLAQLNALEASTNLNNTIAAFIQAQTTIQASTFLGKTVFGKNADGNDVTGVVSEIFIEAGQPQLIVNDQVVKLADVISVSEGGQP